MSERILSCIALGGIGGAGLAAALFGDKFSFIGMIWGISFMFWVEFRKK